MSIRGKTIRGAGGLLQRNTKPGVGIGAPHGGEEGDIRVQMVQGSPRLYARAGGEWYGTNLFSGGVSDEFRIGSSNEYIQVESGNIEMTGKIVLRSIGTQNVCIGVDNNDVGSSNISIGVKAGRALASAALNNICIGTNAGYTLTTSDDNVLIGKDAGYNVSTGNGDNVFVGRNCGYYVTTGYDNVFIGDAAGQGISGTALTGQDNVAIGDQAMHLATTDSQNVVIGKNAMSLGQGALFNVCIGSSAGDVIVAGDRNTIIGASADPSAHGASKQIVIGQSVTGLGDSKITVGDYTDTATLDLDGSDTSWAAASSDERFKENITTSAAGLSFINDLRPVIYNWKKKKDAPSDTIYYEEGSDKPCLGKEYGKTLHGFIAQEVKVVIDNHSEIKEGFKMWKEYDNGVQTVADGNLAPILVKAVQELSTKIDTMQEEINNLKEG